MSLPQPPLSPLLVIVGPTASGKSDLSLALAERFPSEIVNCDSLQVYRHFHIGTGKVPEAERHGVPHHLLDVVEPDEPFTAGDYMARARPLLHEITSRGHLPMVVGGTGFYLRALRDGLFDQPPAPEDLRRRLRERAGRRPASLHRLLQRFDPAAARRIHAHDLQKLLRALEVCLHARAPLTRLHAQGATPLAGFRLLTLGLQPPRAALHERIHQRVDQMFAHGLVDEVQALLACGVPPAAKPFLSLGYAQVLQFLGNSLSLPEAVEQTRIKTRQYAKRQETWFRREPGIIWLTGFGSEAAIQQQAIAHVDAWLTR